MNNPKALFENNQRLASWCVSRMYGKHRERFESAELQQIALIALWRAARTHDPSRASFSGYAAFVIRRALWRHIRRSRRKDCAFALEHRQAAGIRFPRFSRDTFAPASSERTHQADQMRLIARFMLEIPQRKQDAIWMRLRGWTLEQMGREMRVGKERARQIYLGGIAAIQTLIELEASA